MIVVIDIINKVNKLLMSTNNPFWSTYHDTIPLSVPGYKFFTRYVDFSFT